MIPRPKLVVLSLLVRSVEEEVVVLSIGAICWIGLLFKIISGSIFLLSIEMSSVVTQKRDKWHFSAKYLNSFEFEKRIEQIVIEIFEVRYVSAISN
jgi:hypothetical protein